MEKPRVTDARLLQHTERTYQLLLERMSGEGLVTTDSMLVLVNDGSTDGTWDAIRTLHNADSRVRGICLSRNAGHQNISLTSTVR